jgi:hypothetical protein
LALFMFWRSDKQGHYPENNTPAFFGAASHNEYHTFSGSCKSSPIPSLCGEPE